jgi:cyclophilin family peptidyl-prolyl cis-trans isomerase/HEAT repeat protein
MATRFRQVDHGAAARARLGSLILAITVSSGCAGRDQEASSPDLLENDALQEVVELQTARDAGALVRLLEDDQPVVRARAAFAFASLQDQRAAPALIALLADQSALVRAEAAFALGQMPQGSEDIEARLLAAAEAEVDPTARLRLIEALGKTGRESAAEWLARLPTSDGVGPDGTLALARTLVRGVATTQAVDALLARLTDPDPRVRELAAWGVASAFDVSTWASTRDVVYAALDGYDRSDLAAVQLLRALLRVPDPAGRERMRAWLAESPAWRVRTAAVEGLSAASAPVDRAALLAALDDSSAHVRLAAATALLGAPLDPPELDRIVRWVGSHSNEWLTNATLMRTLVARGRGAFALGWIATIPDDEQAAWVVAVDAIAFLPGEAAARALGTVARSPSVVVAGAAAYALASRWTTEREGPELHPLYYEAFTRALRDQDPRLAPDLAGLLSEAPFRALGSEALLGEARALAAAPPAPLITPDWNRLRELGARPRLVLETERGTVTVELVPEEAPLTVQSVARLAGEGRYDGVPFHRVLANFMAQGGDVARGDGFGDAGFRIPSERTHIRFEAGTAGMARTNEKDTEASQFFLTQSISPHLDGGYDAFGRVVAGMDVVDELIEGDRIVRARIEAGPAGEVAAP